MVKTVWPFYLWFLGVLVKSPFSIFTYQKSSRILRESLCKPLSGVGEIKFFLQDSSNTTKYTTSYPYWMLNNLLSGIPFLYAKQPKYYH